MPTEYVITMDVHCRTTDVCIKTRRGKPIAHLHVGTGIPQLRRILESVPRPRYLALEESSLAGWLYRELRDLVDELVVCEPRRNAHVAKDGDKDDRIDAEKLNDLFRAGFLKKVHQKQDAAAAAAKQLIGAYHDRVERRVAEGSRLLAMCRRWGLSLDRSSLGSLGGRAGLAQTLATAGVPAGYIEVCGLQWDSYEQAMAVEAALHKRVSDLAAGDPAMRLVTGLPGYGPVRSATLVCYLDTPWRFKSKPALWRYVGIGLRRARSGTSLDIVHVEQECNRRLRNVVIGAAQSAILQEDNVFARRYRHWLEQGLSAMNARRNVARDQVAAIWGMWKSGKAFDERLLADPLRC